MFTGEMQISDDKTTPVAVKILKCDASRETKDDFKREVKIMSSFEHGNILKLLGIVPTGGYLVIQANHGVGYFVIHRSVCVIYYFQ